uniref:Uncharacterized protein n=1 Tax=Oryza brachyantha TaxID=4533 RepID=J3L0X9_ORYBR
MTQMADQNLPFTFAIDRRNRCVLTENGESADLEQQELNRAGGREEELEQEQQHLDSDFRAAGREEQRGGAVLAMGSEAKGHRRHASREAMRTRRSRAVPAMGCRLNGLNGRLGEHWHLLCDQEENMQHLLKTVIGGIRSVAASRSNTGKVSIPWLCWWLDRNGSIGMDVTIEGTLPNCNVIMQDIRDEAILWCMARAKGLSSF